MELVATLIHQGNFAKKNVSKALLILHSESLGSNKNLEFEGHLRRASLRFAQCILLVYSFTRTQSWVLHVGRFNMNSGKNLKMIRGKLKLTIGRFFTMQWVFNARLDGEIYTLKCSRENANAQSWHKFLNFHIFHTVCFLHLRISFKL